MTVHVRTTPRPLSACQPNSGGSRRQRPHTNRGGYANQPQRSQRCATRVCSPAAAQKPAERSSGTGSGFAAPFTTLTLSHFVAMCK